ncbi:MAG: 3-hydroxyacyl-CoA dehydrogenase [Dichotomicrobium sp.]
MIDRVSVVGAGLIGRAWAIVFARAGLPVSLYDADADALAAAHDRIGAALDDLARFGLIDDPAALARRISTHARLGEALAGAGYVQECGPETLEAKRGLFAELDAEAAEDAILASSSSGIGASAFTEGLKRPERCLVAHPVNPPYLIPLVELCPGPATAPETVETARALMERVGQAPIVLHKEMRGFALNRLQGALLNEALRLYEDGVASAEDLDRTVKHGLGLRWSFIGPFETIDLNAPGGLQDYARRYGGLFEALGREQADPRPWSRETVGALHRERRQLVAEDALGERQAWRDRRLMALAAHKIAARRDIGE